MIHATTVAGPLNRAFELAQKLRKFAQGELTWAEVEGITAADAERMGRLGCELAQAGHLSQARVIFRGLAELNPRDAAAHAALGAVYQQLGEQDEALLSYDRALKVDPRHPVALASRGELRLLRGDARGTADLQASTDADPEGKTVATRRAQGLLRALAASHAEAVNR